MKTFEEKANDAYKKNIPIINSQAKDFKKVKPKLSSISISTNEKIELCTEIFSTNSGYGILIATNEKIIYSKPSIFSNQVIYIPYNKVQSLEYKKSFLKSDIFIKRSDGDTVEIFHLKCDIITNLLNKLIEKNKVIVNKKSLEKNIPSDLVKQIQDLSLMKEKGILSSDEFEILKKKIIMAVK